ncbi:MAG TPA: hypothetical protein VEK33_19750 [Terriglobales bacterium]|nr:hypothetical protein [Terriglobales bacterium]
MISDMIEQFETYLEMGRNWAARFEEPKRTQEAIQWAIKQIRCNQWQAELDLQNKHEEELKQAKESARGLRVKIESTIEYVSTAAMPDSTRQAVLSILERD